MLLAFDLSDAQDFNQLDEFVRDVNRLTSDNTTIQLVGLKSDLPQAVKEMDIAALLR